MKIEMKGKTGQNTVENPRMSFLKNKLNHKAFEQYLVTIYRDIPKAAAIAYDPVPELCKPRVATCTI